MAVSGLLGRGNLFALEVRAEAPDEVYAGSETLLTLVLRNRRRRLPACLLRCAAAGGTGSCAVLPAGAALRLPLPVTFPSRGMQPLPEVRVSSPFPVNFFVRSIALPQVGEVTVFPAPRPAPRPGGDTGRNTPGEEWRDKGFEGDLTRIGDYRGNEPLKMIH